jgi:hypothetical protein
LCQPDLSSQETKAENACSFCTTHENEIAGTPVCLFNLEQGLLSGGMTEIRVKNDGIALRVICDLHFLPKF